MLRFKNDYSDFPEQKTKRRSIIRSATSASKHNSLALNEYIDVDVGTPTRVRVVLDNASAYRCIHEGAWSKLFQIQHTDDSTETLVVRWMKPAFKNSDRDDIAISVAPNPDIAPVYTAKHSMMHQGMYVSIGVRRYIDGRPLSDILRHVTAEQLDHYKLQVSAIVAEMASTTSDYYGEILDGKLKTSTIQGYITAHNMIEKLRDSTFSGFDPSPDEADWQHSHKPRLCHGSLWPEHIIVKGTSVEGIVGWSSADFMPEIIDRYLYQLWYVKSHIDRKWRRFVCRIPGIDDTPLDDTAWRNVVVYAEAMAKCKAGPGGQKQVSESVGKLIEKTVGQIPASLSTRNSRVSSRNSVSDAASDAGSLSALTDQTIDTWERFTVTTEATITPSTKHGIS